MDAKEQMEVRYAHLGHRRTPARDAQQAETARLIAEIQDEQKNKAVRGWLGTPPPPPRTHPPGEEHKWYKMMGSNPTGDRVECLCCTVF